MPRYFNNLRSFFKKVPARHFRLIIILVLLKLVSSSFLLISPLLSKLYVDDAFLLKSFPNFIRVSIYGAAIFILSTLFLLLEDVIKNKANVKLKLDFVNKFMRKFYSFELKFFQANPIGENIYRLANIDFHADFVVEQYPRLVADLVKLAIILLIALRVNLALTVLLLFLSPLFLLHSYFIQKKLKPLYQQLWESSANLSKKAHEAFSKTLIIKVLGLEQLQRHFYLKQLIKNIRLTLHSFRWSLLSSFLSASLSKIAYGLITIFGGWLIIRGRLSIGSYAAFMLYLVQLSALLESLNYRFEYLVKESVRLEKFLEIMERPPQDSDLPNPVRRADLKGPIEFKHVDFGYLPGALILKNLCFKIPDRSWVAIVGRSGYGKTTLVNLMTRLYEPTAGAILFENVDCRIFSAQDLRKNISMATQQPLLFDMSIRDNISCGLKNITQQTIENAVKICRLDDYLKTLPAGLDSLVGEDACFLSLGIKQRVALARAIVRNPGLLILDEAVSSVDTGTEREILEALRKSRAGLITVIVSHRLFSVKDADRIYFLKSDSQLEEGTHLELMAKSQDYRDFFEIND